MDDETPSEEERRLFREAVRDAVPLRVDRVAGGAPGPAPEPRQRRADERRVRDELLAAPRDPAEVETGEELLYAREGLQHRVLKQLRRGQYSLGAQLDLHGMRVPQARAALDAFLADCRERGVRCARIVHGKGLGSARREPVLKFKVAAWLRRCDRVLAFCSARPADGGTGAVYVLLRR